MSGIKEIFLMVYLYLTSKGDNVLTFRESVLCEACFAL